MGEIDSLLAFDPEVASIDQLIDHVYLLHDRLAATEGRDEGNELARLQVRFQISTTQAQILRYLAIRKICRNENLMEMLYGDRIDQPGIVAIKVQIHKLRRNTALCRVRIETVWGQGYTLTSGRQLLLDVMSGGNAQNDPHDA